MADRTGRRGTDANGGFCFVAIATYITREHRVLDAPVPDGVFQDSAWQRVAYYSTSALLIAEAENVQTRMEDALSGVATTMGEGISAARRGW